MAGEPGVDYELQNDWLVGTRVFYIDVDATVSGPGAPLDATLNVAVDPWGAMFSVGNSAERKTA